MPEQEEGAVRGCGLRREALCGVGERARRGAGLGRGRRGAGLGRGRRSVVRGWEGVRHGAVRGREGHGAVRG